MFFIRLNTFNIIKGQNKRESVSNDLMKEQFRPSQWT